jgi:catechol 2,3-dioxygenase-like lactoylglutathione lyase family enzyme
MIKGLNHIGISVTNLDRSIEFYKNLLGMEISVRRIFEGPEYERLLALAGARGTVALLTGPNARVELFEFTQPDPKPGDPRRPVCDRGITHFCIEVSDIETEYERLRGSGVAFHCEPIGFSGVAKALYGRDPDGNVFEFLELMGGPKPDDNS